jgi:formylglycine-generating enzyme required for sulfatase activity
VWAVVGDRVIDHRPARTGVAIGLIAGLPTAEQYEAAAAQALATAAKIREANNAYLGEGVGAYKSSMKQDA